MIDLGKLTESDKGRRVRYRAFGSTEWGTIRRWNDRYIFVLYTQRQEDGGQLVERSGRLPEATSPQTIWSLWNEE
jgi:hypothetical protein